ncbi:MAG: 2-oxoglutarate dehydrogenase E1 component [Pseudomonadales bacterium]|nr:2-oxoglutarate dehydrogenase E1 component [Pseudomonadales bacterium]
MTDNFLERMEKSSHLSAGNVAYIEALYEIYLDDPHKLPEEWVKYFAELPVVGDSEKADIPQSTIIQHFELLGRNRLKARPESVSTDVAHHHELKQVRVTELISAYRHRGHKRASLDPLEMMVRPPTPVLEIEHHRLTEADLDTQFQTGSFEYGEESAKLREIVDALERTYCGSVGAEYMHIIDTDEQQWVQQRLESVRSNPRFSTDVKDMILERLTAAEGLEKYLHTKYPGIKRFGLEGCESLIPMLHEAVQRSGSHGVVEAVIGMAHRGRLNVLVNILGKNPAELFDEFEGKAQVSHGSGDVKYHQGFSSNVTTPGGEMHLALSFNPSHLEIVCPVVVGSVRGRQDRRDDKEGAIVLPILLHGDASFAGQGVVMETFQMSQTRGFRTGGSIHIIINNQIGFTISEQEDARSTEYCSEIAKMIQAPIFHVNADDPEAVLFVMQVAVDYRMQFKKDVVIDLIGYRRRGHNEAEEPMRTQPLMYKKINQHPTTRTLYADRLIAEGVVTTGKVSKMMEDFRDRLESGSHVALSLVHEPNESLFIDWSPFLGHDWTIPVDTSIGMDRLISVAKNLEVVPEGFDLHRQVKKIIGDRVKMTDGEIPINWGYGEIMAYATLLSEGHGIRLTGQDVGIGTFSHRHAVLHDQKTGERYMPLAELPDSAPMNLFDSFLSEEAVLAFEYGYATTRPATLAIWEAQFGDFANGAQVVIDQFITSGEHKWGRLCGLVLLLPHGYEGAGPEHSSARLERYLQLAAEHNIQICSPTTPAQMFHMVRRQIIRPLRKPLIVMTPKSLLRHKLAISTLEELSDGAFLPVYPEVDDLKSTSVERLILCSGKVYYDLLEQRRKDGRGDIAIVRLEQIYPFPEPEFAAAVKQYPNLVEVVWCQEEPLNQGAWYASQHHMRRVLLSCNETLYLAYAGREASAAAASGLMADHIEQQVRLVNDALYG